ncbi:MAG TPA: hypothetical protein VH416_06300 [Gaiellaceae bacterium]|jgi:hypothetical protein
MNTTPLRLVPGRELARRTSGGIEVLLLWSAVADRVSIEIWHAATGERLEFQVAAERALDAFHHPFAYLDDAICSDSPTLEAA